MATDGQLKPRYMRLKKGIPIGGETDSAIRLRKRTGVTSSRGTEEAGC